MLNNLIQFFNQKPYTFYFDLSFEVTVKRRNLSSKKMEFGEDALRTWWVSNDYLGVDGEMILTDGMSQNDVLQLILRQLQEH